MKILEVNKFFYPRRGAERHFIDLIRLLEGQGHEVAVFSMEHPENLPSPYAKFFPPYVGFNSDDSTFFQRLRGITRVWSFGNQKKMESLLTEFCPDVVHIHNIYHQLSLSILAPIKKLGIP
ncbi:MAG: glycosyltransferase, partial [Candidatus Moraniibacteriota bacterium]